MTAHGRDHLIWFLAAVGFGIWFVMAAPHLVFAQSLLLAATLWSFRRYGEARAFHGVDIALRQAFPDPEEKTK